MQLTRPTFLTPEHDTSRFYSGNDVLDDWLKKRALRAHRERTARTYVVTHDGEVIGYYALCSGAVSRVELVKGLQRNMPDPIPTMVLARLAIAKEWQGRGLGGNMILDAMARMLAGSEIIGMRVMLVHAISEEAKQFYQSYGFRESPLAPYTLMLSFKEIQGVLSDVPGP